MNIQIISANSPKWSNQEHTLIELNVNFSHCGTVPFTASQNDTELHGVELFNRAVSGEFGPIQEFVPIVSTITIDQALSYIDKIAGVTRSNFITTVPGQEMTYVTKMLQAQTYQSSGYVGPVPLMIQAEADAMGTSAQIACDSILAQSAQWLTVGAEIEKIRRTYKIQLSSLVNPTSQQIHNVVSAATAAFGAIVV